MSVRLSPARCQPLHNHILKLTDKEIDNIEFLGHVNAETKKKALFQSHIMIFPTFTEGLPNVILEGMLYGMPIISRATGGIPEVVRQGE